MPSTKMNSESSESVSSLKGKEMAKNFLEDLLSLWRKS